VSDPTDPAPWDYVDLEEPKWVAPGMVTGAWLVYRSVEGVEVCRE
jgi:hypothetical protein